MSRKTPKKKVESPAPPKSKRLWILLPLAIAITAAALIFWPKPSSKPIEITGPVTFSKHIAPILFAECTACHRPSGSGPFELLTYEDARKRAKDIAHVTAKRIMPPWQPEHGYGEFEGERRLSDIQIATIQKWVEQQTPEGDPASAKVGVAAPPSPSPIQMGEGRRSEEHTSELQSPC